MSIKPIGDVPVDYPYPDITENVTCRYCGAILRCTRPGGNIGVSLANHCPVCGNIFAGGYETVELVSPGKKILWAAAGVVLLLVVLSRKRKSD